MKRDRNVERDGFVKSDGFVRRVGKGMDMEREVILTEGRKGSYI